MAFPSGKYADPVTLVSCDSNGLCVLAQSTDVETDSVIWNIFHYDVDFNVVHQTTFKLPQTQELLGTAYDKGDFVILFRNKIKRRKNFTGCVAHYNIYNQSIHTETIEQLPEVLIRNLKVSNGLLLFACRYSRRSEDLLYYKLGTRYVKPLAIENPSHYSIEDFLFDTVRQKVVVCVKTETNLKNDPVLWLCETDFEGDLQYAIDFPDTMDKRFLDVRIQPVDSAEYLFFGTYKERKNVFEYPNTDGIYAIHFKDGNFDEPQYSPIESGKPFLKKLFNRVEINYIMGNVFQNQDQISVVTESYHPVYRETSMPNGHGGTYIYNVLIGYNFLNAYVKTFDKQGKKLWEYTFPFDNLLVRGVESHLRLSFFPQQILFYYLKGTEVVTLLTDNDLNIIEPLRTTPLLAQEESTSKYPRGMNPKLIQWYGDNYLFSVRQYFKPKQHSEDNSVFYIQKLKFK